uniref:Lipase n=1 Tax=Onchocerca volvulus TaxID=6282 RepID=A0A8R1XXN8_ONCVO
MITIVFKLLIYVGLYQITNAFSIKSLPEATMTTLEIVAYYEYPSEIHTVTTDDGYILELHRIPGGKAENRTGNASKFVVFLQHGFVSSSAVWVTNLPNQSAAFIFADAGFDVWMGNVRGNTYSTKHVNYTQNDLKYWDFTFDEFAKYDLDSMINCVLNQTRQHSLYYIGYSEGTLTMFAKLSIDQIFAQKIRKFFALGPISTMAYIKGLIKTAATKFFRPLKMLIKISGNFMASKSLFQKISKSTCSLKSIVEHCENLMFQMIGPPNVRMNVSRIPVYMSHIPAGTSTANVLHWAQMVNSRKIQMYDYGSEEENMMHYNMSTPPLYNLSLINVPDGLLAKIPRKYLIQNNELQNFNHFDFVWSIHAADQIYKPIIEDERKCNQRNIEMNVYKKQEKIKLGIAQNVVKNTKDNFPKKPISSGVSIALLICKYSIKTEI